ncbi:MAG: hypothetical protein AAF629_35595 [Chloroflexota bacterium]
MESDEALFATVDEADTFVHAIARNWREADLNAMDQALCSFAVKLTHHQDAMSPTDLDQLRQHGLDDTAIHDAVQVIAYFNYITRIADSLGVETEDFVEPWGQSK